MEPIPLVPKKKSKTNSDTSHILREVFQELLGQKHLFIGTAQNLKKFRTDYVGLKVCGTEVDDVYHDIKTEVKELTKVEQRIMESHARYLINKPDEDDMPTNVRLLFPTIAGNVVKKYNLLQAQVLLPHITERILNYKIPPFENIFLNPCPEARDKYVEMAILKCCSADKLEITKRVEKRKFKKRMIDVAAILHCDMVPQQPKKNAKEKATASGTIFVPEPDQVIFYNYYADILYEKELKLQNITNQPQRFIRPLLPFKSKFFIKNIDRAEHIAPGTCATITITFKNEVLRDVKELLFIRVPSGDSLYINLIGCRIIPFLKSLVYYDDETVTKEILTHPIKDKVLNYTIECGNCLLGYKKEVKILIQNHGGPAKFFILSEDDWNLGRITCVTDEFVLYLNDFIIKPAYFELKTNEIIQLIIIFNPRERGFCLDKVYMICDTNRIEEIDIIGDCYAYEPCYIEFQVPEYAIPPVKPKEKPKYNLHLGASYSDQKIGTTFTVRNISLLEFPYEWRRGEITMYSGEETMFPIEDSWIEIIPRNGTFAPLSEIAFKVCLSIDSNKIGLFKYVLSLFILDIPEVGLIEEKIFDFGEEYVKNDIKLLTIRANEVEVFINHILIPIYVYPNLITFQKLQYDVERHIDNINIINEGFCDVKCEWLYTNKCNCGTNMYIICKPKSFILKPNESFSCTVFLKPQCYDDIDTTIRLILNNNMETKMVRIKAHVEKPRIEVNRKFFNFGYISNSANVSNKFTIYNICVHELRWRLVEYQYFYDEKIFKQMCHCNSSSTNGILHKQNSCCDIVYHLDTSICKKIFTMLVVYTEFDKKEYETTHIMLVAEVIPPNVSILNEKYKNEVFTIDEEYYQYETISRLFYLHNNAPADVEYYWDEPVGFNKDHAFVTFDFDRGRLYKYSRKPIEVTITLAKCGYITDLFVPCILQGADEPVFLQILCKVKRPHVIFSIPYEDRYFDIYWPYKHDDDNEIVSFDIDYYVQTNSEVIESDQSQFFLPERGSSQINVTLQSESKITEEKIIDSNILSKYPENVTDILEYLKHLHMDEVESYHYPTTDETVPNAALSSDDIVVPSVKLNSIISSQSANFYDYVVEFLNIPCKTVCTKTINITNTMNIPLAFDCSVKNFAPKPPRRNQLNRVLIDLNWKESDYYDERLSDHGILVMLNADTENIPADSMITIEILVYGDTWGLYLEELKFNITNLPTFYLILAIQIVGLPCEFPFLSRMSADLLVDYGHIPRCDDEIFIRSIYVYNSCSIPYTILWHTFVTNLEEEETSPIQILYDIFGFESEQQKLNCKLKFLKYIGKKDSLDFDLLTVTPKETYLKPKEHKKVFLNCKVKRLETTDDIFQLDAVLVGHIYIEKQYSKYTNIILRNSETDIMPIKIPITATVEHPHFSLKCVSGDPNIFMAINDIFNENLREKYLSLIFRNKAKTDLFVGVNVAEPFEVISLKTCRTDSTKDDLDDEMGTYIQTAIVYPNDCAQVKLKCVLNNDFVMNMADVLYKKVKHYTKDVIVLEHNQVKVTKNLRLYQRCNIIEHFPVSVTLQYPLFTVTPRRLHFQSVTIGTYKTITMKILNQTGKKTWIEILLKGEKVFKVDIHEYYLKPFVANSCSLHVTVYFTPKDNKLYRGVMYIKTLLPQYRHVIPIYGSGTFDEKNFCKEDIK